MTPEIIGTYDIHENQVHSTLAKHKFKERIERNPPINPLQTNITYIRIGH